MADPGIPVSMQEVERELLAREARASPDPHVRGYSIYLLGTEKGSSNKALFLSALRDPDKGVRAQAARAVAGLGEHAVPDLTVLLKDNDWRVRYRAAEALGMIGSKRAEEPLIRALSDQKDHVRYMAVKSLGLLSGNRTVIPLIKMLGDENEYVRRMAAISLGKIGGELAETALRNAFVVETAVSVRDAIGAVLGKKSLG